MKMELEEQTVTNENSDQPSEKESPTLLRVRLGESESDKKRRAKAKRAGNPSNLISGGTAISSRRFACVVVATDKSFLHRKICLSRGLTYVMGVFMALQIISISGSSWAYYLLSPWFRCFFLYFNRRRRRRLKKKKIFMLILIVFKY